jgi:spermidine synthase
MTNYYPSEFYKYPIEVDNIDWEVIVTITDTKWRKVIYSWYDLVAKNSESFYITKCLLWGFIKKIPKNVLIIWFWAWAFWKYLEDHIKDCKITWIDIDRSMFKIAKKELNIKTNDFLIMEWSIAIKKLINDDKKYDLILIDVYWSDWNIPTSFQDKKLYLNIKKILASNWILSVNFSNYHTFNQEKYDNIHENLTKIFWKNYIHLVPWKTDRWNVVWIYNLDKKYSSEEINLRYLEKVKNEEILYDPNMIKNIIINN